MKKLLTVLIVFLLLVPAADFSKADDPLKVRFLNVGYGDAILLQFPSGENVLIDAGSPEAGVKAAEVLKGLGISQLDFVVMTHAHLDHFGGIDEIRRHINIRQVYVNAENADGPEEYLALLSNLQKSSIPITVLQRGQEISLGSKNTKILVLNPGLLSGSPNRDSLSLLLIHGKTKVWLTADIPPEIQDEIIQKFPEVLRSDCIQVPHHGGLLSQSFVTLAQDKILVMSTGKNGYGRPLVESLSALSGQLLRTDKDGDIMVTSDSMSLKVAHE